MDGRKLEVLYFYWVNAIDVWAYAGQGIDIKNLVPAEIESALKVHHNFIRLTIAYALLYVVIEAYEEFEFSDKKIDALLEKTDYVLNLKRLRNSVFHFQNDFPLTPKFTNFSIMEGSEVWIRDVKRAFEDFFIQNISFVGNFMNQYGCKNPDK